MVPGTLPGAGAASGVAQATVGPSSPSPALRVTCCQNRTHDTGHFRAEEKGVWADWCQDSHSQPPAPDGMEDRGQKPL